MSLTVSLLSCHPLEPLSCGEKAEIQKELCVGHQTRFLLFQLLVLSVPGSLAFICVCFFALPVCRRGLARGLRAVSGRACAPAFPRLLSEPGCPHYPLRTRQPAPSSSPCCGLGFWSRMNSHLLSDSYEVNQRRKPMEFFHTQKALFHPIDLSSPKSVVRARRTPVGRKGGMDG